MCTARARARSCARAHSRALESGLISAAQSRLNWVNPCCCCFMIVLCFLKETVQAYGRYMVIFHAITARPFFDAAQTSVRVLREHAEVALAGDFLARPVIHVGAYVIAVGLGIFAWVWVDNVEVCSPACPSVCARAVLEERGVPFFSFPLRMAGGWWQDSANRRRLTLNRRWLALNLSYSPGGALRGFECAGGRQFFLCGLKDSPGVRMHVPPYAVPSVLRFMCPVFPPLSPPLRAPYGPPACPLSFRCPAPPAVQGCAWVAKAVARAVTGGWNSGWEAISGGNKSGGGLLEADNGGWQG